MFQPDYIVTLSPSWGTTPSGHDLGLLQYLPTNSTTGATNIAVRHVPTHYTPFIVMLFLDMFLPLITS